MANTTKIKISENEPKANESLSKLADSVADLAEQNLKQTEVLRKQSSALTNMASSSKAQAIESSAQTKTLFNLSDQQKELNTTIKDFLKNVSNLRKAQEEAALESRRKAMDYEWLGKMKDPKTMRTSSIEKENKETNLLKNRIQLYKAIASLETDFQNLPIKEKERELRTLQLDKALEEERRTESPFSQLKTHVGTTESSPWKSTAVSVLSGGILNPAVVQSLGIDKLVGGIASFTIEKLTNASIKKEYGESASAIEKSKDSELNAKLDSIIELLGKKPKEKQEEKKKEEPGLISKLMSSISGMVSMVGTGLLSTIGSTVVMGLLSGVRDNAKEMLSGFLEGSLGLGDVTSAGVSDILVDALPGAVIGSKFGIRGALIGAGLSIAGGKIADMVANWDTIFTADGQAETAIFGIPAPTFGLAVLGATLGSQTAGIKGAAMGAAIGLGGGTIIELSKNLSKLNPFGTDENGMPNTIMGLPSLVFEAGILGAVIGSKMGPMGAIKGALIGFAGGGLVELSKTLVGKVKNWWSGEDDETADTLAQKQTFKKEDKNFGDAPGDVPLNTSIHRNGYIPHNIANNVNAVRDNVVNPLQNALNEMYGAGSHNVRITSSYRNKYYNASVGGASNSKHLTGKAIDLQVDGINPNQLIKIMQAHKIPFTRAIAEKSGNTRWLHVEYDANAQRGGIVASMVNGQYAQLGAGKIANGAGDGPTTLPLDTPYVQSAEERNSTQIAQLNGMKVVELEQNASIQHANNLNQQQPTVYQNNVYMQSDKSVYPVGDFAQTLMYS